MRDQFRLKTMLGLVVGVALILFDDVNQSRSDPLDNPIDRAETRGKVRLASGRPADNAGAKAETSW